MLDLEKPIKGIAKKMGVKRSWFDVHPRPLKTSKLPQPDDGIRLVGFVKCRNEAINGNLARCMKHLDSFCDEIVLCDDSSSDGSLDLARRFTNHTIQLPDEFAKEIEHKQKLLDLALKLDPDWIVWLDSDEIFDRNGELGGIRRLCSYGDRKGIDSFSFLEYNLWKSQDRFRVDELWFKGWYSRVWKNTGNLYFDVIDGLHHRQYPHGLKSCRRSNIKVIHYGFADEERINTKYDLYKRHGQTGYALDRIKNEDTLQLREFTKDWLPPSTLKILVICLIYKSKAYAQFVYDSFTKYTDTRHGSTEFLFIANDPNEELVEFLKDTKINHVVFRNDDPDEYYLKRVYKAWNYGGMSADSDIIVFVNSDMQFSPHWLDNMLKNLTSKRVVTSRLVESGKLRSGKYGVEKDFGRSYDDFDDKSFQKFAKEISRNKIKTGGLFMPCMMYSDTFKLSGGYPIGNRTEKNGRITSGDHIFFYETLASMGLKHVTAFDSIIYHVQEGEMDY